MIIGTFNSWVLACSSFLRIEGRLDNNAKERYFNIGPSIYHHFTNCISNDINYKEIAPVHYVNQCEPIKG